jgi:hypothetical protein
MMDFGLPLTKRALVEKFSACLSRVEEFHGKFFREVKAAALGKKSVTGKTGCSAGGQKIFHIYL